MPLSARRFSLLAAAILACGLLAPSSAAAGDKVVQNGPYNYAGPAEGCPGEPYNCTTKTADVVQITSGDDGINIFDCRRSSCAVVQRSTAVEGMNDARCVQTRTTSGTQRCSITQRNVDSVSSATIDQTATLRTTKGETTQSSKQIVELDQENTGIAAVIAGINQAITHEAGARSSLRTAKHIQDATQRITGRQIADQGLPQAVIDQQQRLTSEAVAKKNVVQKQNTANNGMDLSVTFTQDSQTFDTTLQIDQLEELTQRADSPKAVQRQGADSGGQETALDIDPEPHSPGTSTVDITQSKPWTQTSTATPGAADQSQIDKLRVRLLGLTPDTLEADQTTVLSSGPGAHQRCDQLATVRVQQTGTVDQNCTTDTAIDNPPPQTIPPNTTVTYTTFVEEDDTTLGGRVVDASTTQPVAGATVQASQGDGGASATTDAQGFYRFVDLGPGTWSVQAFHPGYEPSPTKSVELSDGEDATLNFTLKPEIPT